MLVKKHKLPHFKSEEEANFWNTHSITDYLDQLEEVNDVFVLAPALARKIRERSARNKMISIRLAEWELKKSKEIAHKKNVPYQTLMRSWIDQGIRREAIALVK